MLKSAAKKVLWVGRATVFLIGLAAILVILFLVANAALWASGEPSVLGESGQANGITQLFTSDAGAERSLAVEPVARRRATQGYARVALNGTFDPARSKGVNDVVTMGDPANRYCFDLTFKPKVVVGSPLLTNNATVATGTPPDNAVSECPEGYRDAAVRTYAANDSSATPINFKIMFR